VSVGERAEYVQGQRESTYRERPRSRSYETRKQIDVLKPLAEPYGDCDMQPRKLMVFNEGDLVILSIVSQRGTVNLPMSRTSVANLLSHLGQRLAQPEGVKQPCPSNQPRHMHTAGTRTPNYGRAPDPPRTRYALD
jgi:hypothetical protein